MANTIVRKLFYILALSIIALSTAFFSLSAVQSETYPLPSIQNFTFTPTGFSWPSNIYFPGYDTPITSYEILFYPDEKLSVSDFRNHLSAKLPYVSCSFSKEKSDICIKNVYKKNVAESTNIFVRTDTLSKGTYAVRYTTIEGEVSNISNVIYISTEEFSPFKDPSVPFPGEAHENIANIAYSKGKLIWQADGHDKTFYIVYSNDTTLSADEFVSLVEKKDPSISTCILAEKAANTCLKNIWYEGSEISAKIPELNEKGWAGIYFNMDGTISPLSEPLFVSSNYDSQLKVSEVQEGHSDLIFNRVQDTVTFQTPHKDIATSKVVGCFGKGCMENMEVNTYSFFDSDVWNTRGSDMPLIYGNDIRFTSYAMLYITKDNELYRSNITIDSHASEHPAVTDLKLSGQTRNVYSLQWTEPLPNLSYRVRFYTGEQLDQAEMEKRFERGSFGGQCYDHQVDCMKKFTTTNTAGGTAKYDMNIVSMESGTLGVYYIDEQKHVSALSNTLYLEKIPGSIPVEEPTMPFTDINNDDYWYYYNVELLYVRGFLTGRTPTQFEPAGTLTRSEAVALAIRTFYSETTADKTLAQYKALHPEASTLSFTDVSTNEWYAKYVALAQDLKIISGKTASTFAPGEPVTRAEFMKIMMYAAENSNPLSTALLPYGTSTEYKDVQKDSWQYPFIRDAQALNLIDVAEEAFPDRSISRAEGAKITAALFRRIQY
ncbi:MAG: S-layer homology domain-containing protein [Candidatus Gracilibacteria bacterium]